MRVLLSLLALLALAPTSIPRTPDGHPDLQGIWANNTVTMLERPWRFAEKETFTEQEARAYEDDLEGRWRDRFTDLEIQMYEYACHEGNYSLAGILKGARFEEREK